MPYATKKLGEVCEINPKLKNDLSPSLEVGFLTMADVSEDAKITRIQEKKLSEVKKGFTNFINGDVLVAKITPCFENGKGAFVEKMPNGIGFGSTEFHVLRTNNDLLNKYLYYFVSNKSFRIIHAMFMTGSAGQRRVPTEFLKKIKIPLPPLTIQKQIVERLDKIAEAQKLNDGLIQKTVELFQSLLHKELNSSKSQPIFTQQHTNKLEFIGMSDSHPNSPKAMAGKKDWEVKKLEEIITDTTNGFASRPVSDGIGQMRPNNIDSDGTFNLSNIKFVPKNYRNIKNYSLKSGDILFNNTNSVELVGKTAFIDADYDYVFSNHMTRIRTNEKIVVPQFLAIFLQHLYSLGKFRFLCTPWVNQAAVNSTALKKLKIPLPRLQIQKQIVAKLSAVQDYKKQLLEQKSKLKELFDSSLAKSMSSK